MAKIRYSTDSLSWDTVTINQLPDASGSTSFISNTLDTSQVSDIVYNGSIMGAVTDNGLPLVSGRVNSPNVTFNPIYKRLGVDWTTQVSNATSPLRAISYGNGKWIAVSYSGGQARISTDATTWSTTNINTGNSIFSIDFGNSVWAAAGAYSERTTTDGVTWTSFTNNVGFGTSYSRTIAYGNGLWVISSREGAQIKTSTNLVSWDTQVSNFASTIAISSIKYGNNLWVATGNNQMRVSTDAITWTTVTSNFGNTGIGTIGYGNGLWVAGGGSGQMRISTDATTWTTVTSNFGTSGIHSVVYGNGLWVAGGYKAQTRTSTNAVTWTTQNNLGFGTTLVNINNLSYGNDTWVAVGEGGRIASSKNSFSPQLGKLYSFDGEFYQFSPTPTATDFVRKSSNLESFTETKILWNVIQGFTSTSMSYVNNVWLSSLTSSPIRTSTNGLTWTTRDQASNISMTSPMPAAYGQGKWIISGGSGQMRTSTDTITWTTIDPGFGSETIYSLGYGNGGWVAGSNGERMRTSTDAVTWNNFPLGSNRYARNVVYDNNLWIVSGMNVLITSTNAVTWTTRSAIGSVQKIVYGGGKWTAIVNSVSGYGEAIKTSTDTITWTTATISGGHYQDSFTDLAYSNGNWIAVGQFYSPTSGPRVWVSTNATSWTTVVTNATTGTKNSAVYASGRVVIAGSNAETTANANPATLNNMIMSSSGYSAALLANSGRIFSYNTQLRQWDQIDTGISDNFIDGSVSDNGIYHIVGENAVYTSTNSTTWTTVESLTEISINDIIAK